VFLATRQSRWYRASLEVIQQSIKGLPRDQWQYAIQNAYPFGPRRNYPYRQWLKAVADFWETQRKLEEWTHGMRRCTGYDQGR
jgi:hypothetical protein